nr:putative ribonuclease H-like domain-containing protein [Tanacetum cinerariifolium]
MGDENLIRTLGDNSKPSHEGYMNTIELPVGNKVDPSPRGRISLPNCSILSIGKDRKTPQRYPNVSTTSWRISIQSMDSLQGLTPEKPKKVSDALQDSSWVEAMQEELLQFKIQKVWTLVDCPKGVRPIGTKWVLKNKKDKRGVIVRNKARLVAQGHTQEEEIDYDEVFAPVARIKAIRLFLAYALFMGFIVYQMNVKSAFLMAL